MIELQRPGACKLSPAASCDEQLLVLILKKSIDPIQRRRGRPPAAQAHDLEERVLAAATTLFLERGFGRTTLDLVAQKAEVGKSGLYARYPDKAALFAAVVGRSIQTMFGEIKPAPAGLGRPQRLQWVGDGLIAGLLNPRCVALMRITAAEAQSFPDLARAAYEASFEGSLREVLAALCGQGPETFSDLTGVEPDQLALAQRFVELAIQPLSFQAAFAIDPQGLRERASEAVRDVIALLEAGGRLGSLTTRTSHLG